MCLVKLSTVVIVLFPTISPPFGEYRCISLISHPHPACCFHQLRRLRRDQAFPSPILRKMKHWTHISKHVQAEFNHAFWQCVANFTVYFILVAAAPFPIHFSCEYLHVVSSLECTCWQIDDVPLICWCFVHLHVFSCTAVSIMQHDILFQHRPHSGLH